MNSIIFFKRTICSFFIIVCLFSNVYAKDFYLKDYLAPGQKDATPAVLQMLKDIRGHNNARIIIEEGEYDFYTEKAYEQYCYISNHDNSLRRIAFPVIGYNGLEIKGNNAKFYFHGLMMPFLIENSVNVSISGISIDWRIPLHSEALIVAANEKDSTYDLQISAGYPYVLRNQNLIFIKENGYEHDLSSSILFDPARKAVAYNNNKYMPVDLLSTTEIRNKDKFSYPNFINFRFPLYDLQNKEYTANCIEVSPGHVRIKTKKPLPPVGMVLVCKGRGPSNRLSNGLLIDRSSKVLLKDLAIYHAGGMGVIAQRSENITLEKVRVQTNPDGNRMVSTTADATHFVNCKGKIVLNQCVFQNMLDDATNVHGSYIVMDTILGPDKLGVRVGHFQQQGFTFAEPGDRIGFVDEQQSANSKFSAIVKSVEMINGGYYIITFNEKVSNKITKDYVLENLDWYPELTVSNCTIANNRARGILLSTPKKIIVENNYFSNMMSAILIPVELSWWYESGLVEDLTVRNNKFGDCCYAGDKQPVINIHSSLDKNDYTFGKIVIENNEFSQFDAAIIHANGVKELQIRNNIIKKSGSFKPIYPDMPVLQLKHIRNLKVKNVTYPGTLKNNVIIENIETKDVDL